MVAIKGMKPQTDCQKGKILDDCPLVEAEESRWIPCSKRTPEKSGVYIVTEKEYSVDDREHTGRFNLITEQVEFEGGKWRRASFYEVIAWMPLPEPYKAEMESEEE